MKRVYDIFCKVEEVITSVFLCIVTLLVFLSAVARTIGQPINWAQDVSLLLFAWVVFFGADLALKKSDFVSVDMLVRYFPKNIQHFLYYLWNSAALVFLSILIRHGIPLSLENSKRLFQTLGISYSWATISVPVGSLLMMVTILIKIINHFTDNKKQMEEVR